MDHHAIGSGRPWDLTADQEAKLRELWIAILQPLGTLPETVKPTSRSPTTPGKQSRLSLFSKSASSDIVQHHKTSTHKGSLTPSEIRDAYWSVVKHHHPDGVLLRFLRARDWDVDAALLMLPTALHWMTQDAKVNELLRLGESHALQQTLSFDTEQQREGEEFLALMRKGLLFIHGVDRMGRPCLIVRAKLHHANAQRPESIQKVAIYAVETLAMMFRKPIDTATLVFDLSDVGIANVDLALLSFIASVFNKNYPETLGQTIIYRPPWIFQSFWKIVQGWLPPDTVAKFLFLSTPQEVAQYIPEEHIPKFLGGTEDWKWQYIEPTDAQPKLEQSEQRDIIFHERQAIIDAFELETIKWLDGGNYQDARAVRDKLADELVANYWRLDPYVRNRSVYDRLGLLPPRDVRG